MNEGLEYAQMLEIPVNTVSVVKKKPLFGRGKKRNEDLKDKVVESVNEKVTAEDGAPREEADGTYIATEQLSGPSVAAVKDKFATRFLIAEGVAAGLIAAGIFLTNMLVPNTAINAFMGSVTTPQQPEAAYNELTLSPVVSILSDAEVTSSPEGVITLTGETSVYPVCEGEVASVTVTGDTYTVEIAHTSTFSSVISGLSTVYVSEGDKVEANIPFAYSDGSSEVKVTMYDGENLISGYTLSGVVPVWTE